MNFAILPDLTKNGEEVIKALMERMDLEKFFKSVWPILEPAAQRKAHATPNKADDMIVICLDVLSDQNELAHIDMKAFAEKAWPQVSPILKELVKDTKTPFDDYAYKGVKFYVENILLSKKAA